MMRYVLCGIAALASTVALAEEPSYSFFQASYQDVELDNSNVDGNGLAAVASIAINDDWHVFAGYSSGDFDSSVDLDDLSIGVGWHRDIAASTDFFVELAYVRADFDIGGFSGDDSGIGANVGVRSMVSDKLEVYGAISHVELDNAGGGTALGAGLWYALTGNFAIGAGASFDDDATAYGVGVRLYFER